MLAVVEGRCPLPAGSGAGAEAGEVQSPVCGLEFGLSIKDTWTQIVSQHCIT